MKRQLRTTAALLVVAAALLVGAGLVASKTEAEPSAAVSSGGRSAPAAATPLPDFQPSEELPADAAVAFPTDI